MNAHDLRSVRTRTRPVLAGGIAMVVALLGLAACSPKQASQPEAASATPPPAATAVTSQDPPCTNEPRADENDKRPRCGGMAIAPARSAFRVVGGSGDPVDQVVCDISETFMLDGKLFGVEFSGGVDGTWKFVRTPNIPGLSWKAGGRYHIEFPDGAGNPGILTTEGGGTTTAGAQSRDTTGAERFTLTPTEVCKQ